jgi:hypothetical protein
MAGILYVVETWHPYLIGRIFYIKIDHHNLKYFLEKWFSSLEKHKWVINMLGYDYEIIYKGKENVVANGLSKQFKEDGSLFALSLSSPRWIEEAHKEWLGNNTLRPLIQRLQGDPNPPNIYTWKQDTLWYKGHIVLLDVLVATRGIFSRITFIREEEDSKKSKEDH